MRKINLLISIIMFSTTLFAQTRWVVDKAHSKVGFTVTHLSISEVDGNFKKFDANIISTKPDFSDAVFEMIADVSSVSTDNEERDNHIKGPDFFDATKFPLITFKSKTIVKTDGKKYKLTGDLTMHGITKEVTLDLTLNGIGKDMPSQKPIAGFKVTGIVNRKDFGVGRTPSAIVSEDIEIKSTGEFGQI